MPSARTRISVIAGLAALLLASPARAETGRYVPAVPPYSLVASRNVSITFTPEKRPLDLRVTWPEGGRKLPVLIWSHGAFGSRDGYTPLTEYWARHGYVVIQPTHQDSIQKGTVPSLSNPLAFREWDVRPREVSFIIGHLGDIVNEIPETGAAMDQDRIAVGGHSFGANTALLVAGMTAKSFGGRKSFKDARPLAFIALSPQGTGRVIDEKSFTTIDRPALFATGSNDDVRVKDYRERLQPFNLSPPGDKYLLFIDGAHHDFGGISGARYGGSGPPSADTVDQVRSTVLAFLDAYVRKNAAARAWLTSGALARATGGTVRMETRQE